MNSNGNLGITDPDKDYDILQKILLIGDLGVGKTSLLVRFAEQKFYTHMTTIGFDFKVRTIQIGNTRVKLQAWDTVACVQGWCVISKPYYRNAAGIIIAYDVTNGESFFKTKRWIEEVKKNCGDDGVPIVLVGNKTDSPNKVVSFNDQQEYAKLMNLKFFETSAKENINVDEVFTELTRLILERQKENQQLNREQQQLSGGIRMNSHGSNKSSSKNSKCC